MKLNTVLRLYFVCDCIKKFLSNSIETKKKTETRTEKCPGANYGRYNTI